MFCKGHAGPMTQGLADCNGALCGLILSRRKDLQKIPRTGDGLIEGLRFFGAFHPECGCLHACLRPRKLGRVWEGFRLRLTVRSFLAGGDF